MLINFNTNLEKSLFPVVHAFFHLFKMAQALVEGMGNLAVGTAPTATQKWEFNTATRQFTVTTEKTTISVTSRNGVSTVTTKKTTAISKPK